MKRFAYPLFNLGIVALGLLLQLDLCLTNNPIAAMCLWLYVVGMELFNVHRSYGSMTKLGKGLAMMAPVLAGIAMSSFLMEHPFKTFWLLAGVDLLAFGALYIFAKDKSEVLRSPAIPYAVAFIAVPMVLCNLGITIPYDFIAFTFLLMLGAGQALVSTEYCTQAPTIA